MLPVLESSESPFAGREYLSLYTPVTLEDAAALTRGRPGSTLLEPRSRIEEALNLAKAAHVDLNEFVRQMQQQPRLAGEWLRPHARATIEQGPKMTTLEPEQATAEVKSAASIYYDEWLKVLRAWTKDSTS
jgi:hypothetical protein